MNDDGYIQIIRKSHCMISDFLNEPARDAIFPDFSGIPDFHKLKLSMKTAMILIQSWKDLASYCCFNDEDVVSAPS